MPKIIKVDHCLTCPYGKMRYNKPDSGLYCKIIEERVAGSDTVGKWDNISLSELSSWVYDDCPLDDISQAMIMSSMFFITKQT